MKNPSQCLLWNKTHLTPADLDLELLKVFQRDAHIERDLFKCRECGQLFFHEWYEHVNFTHDAYMYDTYIPVETDDDVKTLSDTKTTLELMQFFPQLHGSFTNGKKESVQWLESIES